MSQPQPPEELLHGVREPGLDYRGDDVDEDASPQPRSVVRPLDVGITGSSGLIGSALAATLTSAGHAARPLPRTPTTEDVEGLDAVVHLAGEPIDAPRWTAAKKARIKNSRAEGTRAVAEAIASARARPAVLVSASGVNIYGDRGDERLDEGAPLGDGFLADVARVWEESCAPARDAGARVVNLRTGVVLAGHGGALPRMALPFKLGLGGTLGDLDTWFPWVHLDDVARVYARALVDERLTGAVNLVAGAVQQRELAATLGRVLRRPSLLRVPGFALKAALGSEQADELLLTSMRVVPGVLRAVGYDFRFDELEPALREALA